MSMIVPLHLVVMEVRVLTWCTTTNAFANCPTPDATAMRNWILAHRTSAETAPNVHHPATFWISCARANLATLDACATKTSTNAPFRRRAATAPPVRTRTARTSVYAPRATKVVTV